MVHVIVSFMLLRCVHNEHVVVAYPERCMLLLVCMLWAVNACHVGLLPMGCVAQHVCTFSVKVVSHVYRYIVHTTYI